MPQLSVFQLILQAGLLVKAILLILLLFSIASWAIILERAYYFWAAARQSAAFRQTWGANVDPRLLLNAARALTQSPLASVFVALSAKPGRASQDELRRTLRHAIAHEAQRPYTYLIFLATAGSSAPFIGLLGTVWGIMNAFQGVGATSDASLAVVAPGIAEALVSTAAGLAVAIPAVMAYNYYMHRARRVHGELEQHADDLLELCARRAA